MDKFTSVILIFGTVYVQTVSLLETTTNLTRLTGRIVGGVETTIQSYPYQLSVQKNGKHNCGGSILSSNYILTAAHCLNKNSKDIYTVRAGHTFRDEGGSVHKVDKIIFHIDTKLPGQINGDLAILHLSEPIKFDSTRQPISLYNASEKITDGQATLVTGWGRTKSSGELSKQLRVVMVPIVNQKICNKAYKGQVKENQICAGYYEQGGKDACQGDSGGPLAIDGRLAGVTFTGYGCAKPKFPGVYMSIPYYHNWIKKYAQL